MSKSKTRTSSKRPASTLPKITLHSPASAVVKVVARIIEWFSRWTSSGLDRACSVATGQNIPSIRNHLDQAMPHLGRVCDWLRANRKKLYDPVWTRYQEVKSEIKETHEAIVASETDEAARRNASDRLVALQNNVGQMVSVLKDVETDLSSDCAGRPLKRRGPRVLNDQVGKLLNSSPSSIKARDIADTLNENYRGVHRPTTIDSVKKTENWKQRNQTKKTAPKK